MKNTMKVKKLIRTYLANNLVMQLATVSGGKPHICTVHYALDANFNFYWYSSRLTHHSMALEDTPHAAVGVLQDIALKQCIHAEGQAYKIATDEVVTAYEIYSKRFGENPENLKMALSNDQHTHAYYVFKPSRIMLYDAANFPDKPILSINMLEKGGENE